jgi:AcrR family transcriptional regulator
MHIPLRVVRARIEAIVGRPEYSTRHVQRESRILNSATIALAAHGRHGISLSILAQALCIDKGSLRWHFADLDGLLPAILHAHTRLA